MQSARKEKNKSFLNKNSMSGKLSFKNEGEGMTFPDKLSFTVRRPDLKEKLKGILQDEMKKITGQKC
jgi:hypothetical protein